MPRETSSGQIGELQEQLNLQAEAILKLVEVVSGLDGVDAASLGTYSVRVQRQRVDPVISPTGGAGSIDPPSAPEPSQPAQQPGGPVLPGDHPPGIT